MQRELCVSDFATQRIVAAAAHESLLQRAGVCRHLEEVVGEMHSSTWFTFPRSKNSDPHSLLNFVMVDIMRDVREALRAQDLLTTIYRLLRPIGYCRFELNLWV